MPSPLSNPQSWTLRRLVQNTYAHMEFRNRFDYKQRDMVHAIRIEEIKVYDGKNPGDARTKFIIRSQSTPQYFPYYQKVDARGRPHKRQMKYRHQYQVTIQLDKLSINVPFKGRTGSQAKWDFGPNGKTKRIKHGRSIKIIESSNYIRGINPDFWFRSQYAWKRAGILFGRDWTNGPPLKVNPRLVIFADKHFLACVQVLMERGYLK